MMYVPTFQGLSPFDWLRPADAAAACFPFTAKRMAFYRARNAIYHLFNALNALMPRLTVLVPDYNSGNEVLALRASGATLRFYRINRRMQPDLDDIERLCKAHDPEVLYVIHYLGWPQPLDAMKRLCHDRSMLLVEDCALSLLSEPNGLPLGSQGDWSIFCLYKTLPVPNGALLVENTLPLMAMDRLRLRRAGAASVVGRMTELMVQRLRARVNSAGRALHAAKRAVGRAAGALDVNRSKVGDLGFNLEDVDLDMSPASRRLLQRFDYRSIRERRIANHRALTEALGDAVAPATESLPAGACPLFLPIEVADKPAAARALRTRGIDALEFWNHGADAVERDSADVRHLRTRILGLPIHQDVRARQLDYIAAQCKQLHRQAA
jgi:dTDP-4-amino-4,6-dideoxygalactose transaminase